MPPRKESQAAKAARLAKEKKDKERAAKERKETANARAQANAEEPAPTADRIPKKKKRNGVEFSASDSDSAKSNSAEDHEDDDDNDTEVEDHSDLAAGDAACRVTNCGLGNALSTNCPRHQKAANEQLQAANVPRERRNTTAGAPKQAETGESSSTPTKQPARDAGRKEKQRSNKLVESQVQQALTSTLAPFLEQFRTMLGENAARAVRPCLTGYIR